MGREGTVAPRERVNITYKPALGEASENVELPLKLLVLTDLSGSEDGRPVEERAPIALDRDSFARVMAEQKLRVRTTVPNRLSESGPAELEVDLEIRSLADFTPDGLVEQVPQLRRLLELRRALTALKGPLGNVPAFRRRIQALLADEGARSQLSRELAERGHEGG